MLPKYLAKATKIIGIILIAITSIDVLLLLIKKLIAYLEFIYLKYIQKCTVANQTPIDSSTGNINEDLLIGAEDVSLLADEMTIFYNELLITLEQKGYTLQTQRLYSINSNIIGSGAIKRSYSLIETPKTD